MAHAQKPDFVFQRNGLVHLNRQGVEVLFSRLLPADVCGSAGSDCIIFRKYVDHRLKMSTQVTKKWLKRGGERETVHNVYKFMNIESDVGNTISLS